MKHMRLFPTVALVSLLAACGGGGGGGVGSGPTVTSAGAGNNTGSSTSTNTPTGSSSDSGSTSGNSSPQAGPASTVAGYTVVDPSDRSSVLDQALPTDPSDTTVTVDLSTKTITVTSQKYNINDTVTPTDAPTFFQNGITWGDNGFPTIASSGRLTAPNDGLQYSEYGLWQSLVSAQGGAGGAGVLRGAYANGQQTLPENMPKAGTLNYQGSAQILASIPAGDGDTYGLTGLVSATANFNTGTINLTVTPNQVYATQPNVTTMPSVAGSSIALSGTISGNKYNGNTVSGNVAGIAIASGTVAGQFNGPQADETSAVFNFAGAPGSGLNGIGALGAKAQH